MAYLIGTVLALVVALFARIAGFDRDRAFYPTLVVVIALYYDLFAVISGSPHVLLLEMIQTMVFVAAAVLGLRRFPWLVAVALAAHGLYDFVHPHLFANPGVPAFWPPFCAAYDVTAAVVLAWLQRSRVAGSPRAIG